MTALPARSALPGLPASGTIPYPVREEKGTFKRSHQAGRRLSLFSGRASFPAFLHHVDEPFLAAPGPLFAGKCDKLVERPCFQRDAGPGGKFATVLEACGSWEVGDRPFLIGSCRWGRGCFASAGQCLTFPMRDPGVGGQNSAISHENIAKGNKMSYLRRTAVPYERLGLLANLLESIIYKCDTAKIGK
jgi:hypothetical protein